MNRLVYTLVLLLALQGSAFAKEFTVLVYNVENLFDLDGYAEFTDYRQSPEGNYDKEPFLGKLESIKNTLAAFNEGEGPEIVMFQELEMDHTPEGTPDTAEFLEANKGTPVSSLLVEGELNNLPAHLLLLKYLEDNGLKGYEIALGEPVNREAHPPHNNVIFTKFPVSSITRREKQDARDLLIVEVDVHGQSLILMNNHWKSGASNGATEPTRVQNAHVVKAALLAELLKNPQADVIIAGDLNCYYNQSAVFPNLDATGVNDVLESGWDESVMISEDAGGSLYNLWYELDPEDRGSEVYRGYWGTLMQIILTPGLYDSAGIQYVDNSFNRLMIPGENVGDTWNLPRRWIHYGDGSGYSDHLPVYATFRVVDKEDSGKPYKLTEPKPRGEPDSRPRVPYEQVDRASLKNIKDIEGLEPPQIAERIGEIFLVDSTLITGSPPKAKLKGHELSFWSFDREVRNNLKSLAETESDEIIAELGEHRGKLQLVIQHASWIEAP